MKNKYDMQLKFVMTLMPGLLNRLPVIHLKSLSKSK
jgi:hypothetical protein